MDRKRFLKTALGALLLCSLLIALLPGCMTAGERESFAPSAAPSETPAPTPAPTEPPTETPTEPPAQTPAPVLRPTPPSEPDYTEEPTPEPETAAPKPTRTPAPTSTPKPGGGSDPEDEGDYDFTMMFVGDLMCLSGQQYGAMNQASGGDRFDFRPSFKYVKDLLSRADCAVGNLETTICDSWPYAYQQKEIDGKPNCNAPAKYLDALAMCNNHCCDAGRQGIIDTIEAVGGRGFKHTGTFRSESEKRWVMLSIKGVKVALLSYSEFYNGKQGCVGGDRFMLNTYSESTARRDIANARSAGAQLVVVYEHWGREHSHVPTDTVRRHARELANAGADIICGSHSHAVQPVVWLKASDGRRVLCMYSLGNFVSSMSQQAANDTFIEEVRIKVTSGGRAKPVSEKSHTCRVFNSLGGKYFVVVPTSNTSIPSIRSQLEAARERILAIIHSER